MKIDRRRGVWAGVFVVTTFAAVALAATAPGGKPISAQSAKFEKILPGVTKAKLWGDDTKGPYGSFTRFEPGHVNPLHTHPNDLHITVLEGAYIYTANGNEVRVGPKEYFLVPAGVPHTSGGDKTEGALFLEQGDAPFGFKPLKPGVGGSGNQ